MASVLSNNARKISLHRLQNVWLSIRHVSSKLKQRIVHSILEPKIQNKHQLRQKNRRELHLPLLKWKTILGLIVFNKVKFYLNKFIKQKFNTAINSRYKELLKVLLEERQSLNLDTASFTKKNSQQLF